MKLKKHLIRGLAFCLLFPLFTLTVRSQGIEGDWYGKADLGGVFLRLNIHVKASGETYTSTFDSPDQGVAGIPSTTTTFKYPDFSFSFAGAGFVYNGKVDESYSKITGKLNQNGRSTEIIFGRTVISAPKGSLADLKQKYTKQEVYITMRDGKRLFTSIYTPKNSTGNNPILLDRTPYDIEPEGPDGFNYFLQVWSRYTEDNYIMVFQDVRGKYMSEGSYEDIRPVIEVKKNNQDIDESTDTWDTVDWLVKNVKGNNGNVGIFGISYPGFYSTMGIINAHPAVKAVSPQAPVTAWFLGDDFHHNGAFFLLDCFSFYYSNGREFKSPTRRGFPGFRYPMPDNYAFYLGLGAIKNITSKYLGDSIKFWNDAFAHPDYDAFWKARDPRQFLKNVTPAVMTVGGWFDAEDLYGTIHTYEAIESQNPNTVRNTFVMGPWSHGQWAAGEANNLGNIYWGQDANKEFQALEKKFFDYYLKGEGDGNFAEATIFVTGSDKWRTFDSWPPKNTTQKSLYMQPSGKLDYSIPSTKESFDEYVSDPSRPVPYAQEVHTQRTTEYMTDDQRFAARRPDVMVYESDVLADDVTLTGPLTADLFVSTTGTDADFIVKLIDVYPADAKAPENIEIKTVMGGYQMLVRGEVFRGRYRNSFEKPEAFVPGKVSEVKYEMPDVAHTFLKGHRIMIQVQNSWFPLVDRNPQKFVNIYKCSDTDFQKATMRIYHDTKYPTCVRVNVLQ
ncbi:MAG TPA: CocE/NonD family hydrolase [Bacteroidales bacterium]|nr:CocE/NonD family hydrolase [Bacteroidales bacterium]